MQTPQPQNESSRLDSLRSYRILNTSSEQVYDDIAHLASLICDVPVAIVAFVDEQRVWFKAKVGLELNDIPREGACCTYAILQSDVLIVSDPSSDERFMSSMLVNQVGIRFYAAISLMTDDGLALGTLAVMDRVPHLMTTEQSDSLRILARRVMRELELRRTAEGQSVDSGLHLAPTRQSSATILLVEDNASLRKLLHRTLEGAGFSVFSATDGTDALRLYAQEHHAVDLVVSDIVMTGLNGIELADRILADRPEMKFLFITGFGNEFPLHERMKYGATTLEKPFLPSDLVRKVEDTLQMGQDATGTQG
ncbi:MAG: response regulator [Terriglobales bacterium]